MLFSSTDINITTIYYICARNIKCKSTYQQKLLTLSSIMNLFISHELNLTVALKHEHSTGSCFKDKQYFQILIITFFLLNPPIFKRKGSCFKDKQYFQILIITFFLLNPPIFKRKGSGNWRQGKFAIVQVRDETQVLSK